MGFPVNRRAGGQAVRGSALLLALMLIVQNAFAQSRDWTPEDRAIIGDFTRVNAVAIITDRIYSVTPDAVLSHDPMGRRWEGPFSPTDPGLLRDVIGALADPLDHSLWLVRRNGWVRFDPGIRLWEQGFIAGS